MNNSFPMIGVSGSIDKDERQHFILRSYMQALLSAGAMPMLLAPDMDEAMADACLARLDGIFLAGGNDAAPEWFGQEPIAELGEVTPLRDAFEISLTQKAHAMGMPVLGVCRGIQMMNVAMGGTLWQDLPSQYRTADGKKPIAHQQNRPGRYPSHAVKVTSGTVLHGLVQADELRVNSFHHQAVAEAAACLRVTATAPDGVIEAVEDAAHPFFVGVQWHPERYHDLAADAHALFVGFAEAASVYRVQKEA